MAKLSLDAAAALVDRATGLDLAARELSGLIERVHGDPRPNWTAGKLRTKSHQLVSFVARAYLREGETVTLTGCFESHAKYGPQFRASDVAVSLPASPEGVAAWLRWNGERIGEKTADRLVEQFGAGVLDMLATNPHAVAVAAKVPLDSVNALAALWHEHRNLITATTQLAALGLTRHQCESIVKERGTTAPASVRADPYSLVGDVDGIGWSVADEIAAKVGITGADPRRVRGAVHAVARERMNSGHTATFLPALADRAAELLGGVSREAVGEAVADAVAHNRLVRIGTGHDERDVLALPGAARAERFVRDFLATSRAANPVRACAVGAEEEHAEAYRQCGPINLDDEQLRAVVNAFRFRFSTITGGAGAGKSSMTRAIVKAFIDAKESVFLTAPTGRAARRLTDIIGMEAQTLHRLLAWHPKEGFRFNATCRLPRGLYCVDESSMIDVFLAWSFFSALPDDACVVLVGDVQQLPPVGPGAVLRDIIAHKLAPVTALVRCHRQAGALKRNCSALLAGTVAPSVLDQAPSPWLVADRLSEPRDVLKAVQRLYQQQLPAWGFGPTEWVFLAPRLSGALGVNRLNRVLQWFHQRARGNEIPLFTEDEWDARPTFYVGDRCLQIKNNYELRYEGQTGIDAPVGVMNGTCGVVVATEPELVVRYDDGEVRYTARDARDVQLAYCLSCHKFQGSQIPCAVVVVPKGAGGFVGRNWIYTACTRSTRCTVVLGDGPTIRRAAERGDDDGRQTVLAALATGAEGDCDA